jgi:hypothetical protein
LSKLTVSKGTQTSCRGAVLILTDTELRAALGYENRDSLVRVIHSGGGDD